MNVWSGEIKRNAINGREQYWKVSMFVNPSNLYRDLRKQFIKRNIFKNKYESHHSKYQKYFHKILL